MFCARLERQPHARVAPAKTGPLLLTAATGAGSDQAAAAGAGRTVSWRNVIVSHVRSARLFLYSENYCPASEDRPASVDRSHRRGL